MNFDLSALFFLRPQWLWALLALPPLAWLWRARRRRASVWRQAVDAHLLPHLLEPGTGRRSRLGAVPAALAYVVAVLALAGPGWREAPQPLWQTRAPLVIALDLSGAMLAPDLPPTRVAQARAKLATLLRERRGGQVALLAFADEPFTVAPLTDDARNVALFLEDLTPDVMPVDGQRADRAIDWAAQLLQRTGFGRGDILLLTDHADAAARASATAARRQGYTVSVLGLGTPAGANVRLPDGGIGRVQLDAGSLQALARAGGGTYAALTPDDADLRALGVLDPTATDATARGATGHARRDEGYWLLPLLMLLALPAFRRRGAVAVLALGLLLPWQARAADWWRRPDQAAHQRMEQAAQAYRKGDFKQAAQLYGGLDGADAQYNRGNALAKAGQYEAAIAAYDRALRQRPGMPDAVANRRAVLAAMQRQPPKGPGQDGGKGQQGPQRQGQQGSQGQQGQQGQQQGQQQQGARAQQPGRSGPSPSSQPPARSPGDKGATPPQTPDRPADAKAQQAADAAQRARMQQALQQQRTGRNADGAGEKPARAQAETPAQRERRLANEAWLRRVPDDPGGLLRAKFQLEYERRHGVRPPED